MAGRGKGRGHALASAVGRQTVEMRRQRGNEARLGGRGGGESAMQWLERGHAQASVAGREGAAS